MHRDRLLFLKALVEVLGASSSCETVYFPSAARIVGGKRAHPAAIEVDYGFLGIEILKPAALRFSARCSTVRG